MSNERNELYYVGWAMVVIVVAGAMFNLWRVMV